MSAVSKYIGQNISFSGSDMVVSVDTVLPNGKKFNQVIGSLQTMTYSVHMDKSPVRSVGNANPKDYVFGPRTIAGSLIFAVFNRHFAYDMLEAAADTIGSGNHHVIMDEMPPFNITVSFANEYGRTARLAIYGVRIINEGQTMSINDIYTENTYQFVATDIEYLNDAIGSSTYSVGRNIADQAMVASRQDPKPRPIPFNGEEDPAPVIETVSQNNNLSISLGRYGSGSAGLNGSRNNGIGSSTSAGVGRFTPGLSKSAGVARLS